MTTTRTETTTAERIGDWACTASGRQFWPEDPRPGDFDIDDIAHALGHLCRFAGHCRTFYSVAQHSVHVSLACDPADALWGLLHDATEAYLVDVPRPLKRAPWMSGYRRAEQRFMHAIATQFGLSPEMPLSVKRADNALLAAEAHALMPEASVRRWYLPETAPAGLTIEPWTPVVAQRRFLRRFDELTA